MAQQTILSESMGGVKKGDSSISFGFTPTEKARMEQLDKYDPSTDPKILEEELNGTDKKYVHEGVFGDSIGNESLAKSGILGMPFQFNKFADVRPSGKQIGRVFGQTIIKNLPLVIFQVGKPRFMDPTSLSLFNGGQQKKESNAIYKLLGELDEGTRGVVMDSLGMNRKGDVRYYSFEDDYRKYTEYVNTFCRFTAIKMGLDNYNFGKGTITPNYGFNFDVKKIRNDTFITKALAEANYFAAYVDNATNYSESGSNQTGDSMLATGLKQAGEIKREADFLFGGGAGNKLDEMNTNNYNEKVNTIAGQWEDSQNLVQRLLNYGGTVMSGGNLLFPEIWKDSSHRKSYTIDLKFHSPYGDPVSVFLNVYVPLFHILAMAMPRQNSKQGYSGPPIIKMYSKGWFNCDLGMVESIDIKKAGASGNEWSIDKLPTQIDVSLNIKDLYPTIMLTAARGTGVLFNNNTGLVDYLNVMTGIDMHGINWLNNIKTMLYMRGGGIVEIPQKVIDSIAFKISNQVQKVAKKILMGEY